MPISHSFSRSSPGLARRLLQSLGSAVDVGQHLVQGLLRDGRIGAQRAQAVALPLQLLDHLGLQVGAAGHVEDLEQRQQRGMVLEAFIPLGEEAHALVQALHPQQRADPLVEREVVADHGAGHSTAAAAGAFRTQGLARNEGIGECIMRV
jgi:hypothetical protein